MAINDMKSINISEALPIFGAQAIMGIPRFHINLLLILRIVFTANLACTRSLSWTGI